MADDNLLLSQLQAIQFGKRIDRFTGDKLQNSA